MNYKLISLLLAISLLFTILTACGRDKRVESEAKPNVNSNETAQWEDVSEIVSTDSNSEADTISSSAADTWEIPSGLVISSSDSTTSSEPTESKESTTSSKTTSSKDKEKEEDDIEETLFPGYKYNSVFEIEDNVFLDSLVYTGYNLKKHRADGQMWNYILASDKRHRGWLSDITYAGGSTGLETKNGVPDISAFEANGLVCASFVSYVYYNYLPNVAKIDTSSLDVPNKPYLAESVNQAAKKWLKKGYTYTIDFTAYDAGSGIYFEPKEEIPIGSLLCFSAGTTAGGPICDHVAIYVGKKNGYHWVIQVGNENGPEFCAVERFKFGPDPMFPLEIYATPTCIYDGAGEKAKN